MDQAKSKFRFLAPSVADIVFLSVFLILSFSTGKGLLADSDTGWHIRTGEFIIDTLSIPRHDIFSYRTPPIPWTAHEWLSEVIMAIIHRAFGLTGVVIFFSLVIAFIYYLLFKVIRTYKGNIFADIIIVLLVIGSSQIHWLARPHIFSLLLASMWYYLLDFYQYDNKNYLYLLPPLMLLWVNLHGGFIVAFMLSGIYIAGNLIKSFISKDGEKAEFRKKAGLIGLTTFTCLLISIINPYGYNILLFPFKLTSDKILMNNVSEFLSPNFHEPILFTYLLLLTIAILAVSKKRLNFIELVLVLLFAYMSLYSARYILLFAVIVAPILIRQAKFILEHSNGRFISYLKQRSDRIASVAANSKGHLWPVAAILIVIVFAASGKIEFKFDEKIKPVAAVEFLKKEHLNGNMFNNDQFGGYIIYSAHQQYKVFIDGRLDMYGAENIKEYFNVTRMDTGWDDVLKKYNVNWIIFDAESPLARFFIERSDWKLIYADKVADIFVRNIPENRELIGKYRDVKPVIEKVVATRNREEKTSL